MGFRLAADLVVVIHLTFVVFVLVGGYLAWRWRAVLRLHIPAVATSAALALAGLDCPLTDVEKWLRRRAGDPTYPGGFIAHYLVGAVHAGGMTPAIRLGLRVVTVSVVAIAYLVLLMRRRGADAAASPSGAVS